MRGIRKLKKALTELAAADPVQVAAVVRPARTKARLIREWFAVHGVERTDGECIRGLWRAVSKEEVRRVRQARFSLVEWVRIWRLLRYIERKSPP